MINQNRNIFRCNCKTCRQHLNGTPSRSLSDLSVLRQYLATHADGQTAPEPGATSEQKPVMSFELARWAIDSAMHFLQPKRRHKDV